MKQKIISFGLALILISILYLEPLSAIALSNHEVNDRGAVVLVRLDKTSISMSKGEAVLLTATPLVDGTITWYSSNPSIATVTSYGLVVGISSGTTYINASITTVEEGIKRARCMVSVNSQGIIENGTYYVQNQYSRKIMDVEGPSMNNGAIIQQWDYHNGLQGMWNFILGSDGYYTIQSCYSSKYIQVSSNPPVQGATITQNSTISSGSKWAIMRTDYHNFAFVPASASSSLLVLNSPGTSNGSDLNSSYYSNNSDFKDEWACYNANDLLQLGDFDVWNSTGYGIGYWNNLNIKLYCEKTATSPYFLFNTGVITAKTQWCDVLPVSFVSSSEEDANIDCYGLTADQYHEKTNKNWVSTHMGLTSYSAIYEGYVIYEYEFIKIYTVTHADIFINYNPTNTVSEDVYKQIATHEMGHALGYFDHSPNSTDVMYSTSHSSYTLKINEKNHISQIYSLVMEDDNQ